MIVYTQVRADYYTVGQPHDIKFYIMVNSCECHVFFSIMVFVTNLNVP